MTWFKNFGFELAESPTFARDGGNVDATIYRLADESELDDITMFEDLTQ